MPRLVFVTPCFERYTLTAICLEQRRRVCDELATSGIDATCVVVADDVNARTARELDFHVLERPNYGLCRRFNDGMEYAGLQLGADYIAAIGSDDFCTADYAKQLPAPGTITSSARLCVVSPHGDELTVFGKQLRANPHGFIPWLIPAPVLARLNYRPVTDSQDSGLESALGRAIKSVSPSVEFQQVHTTDFQVVDFKSPESQVTGYKLTVAANVGRQAAHPFDVLAAHYPADLLHRMQALYSTYDPSVEPTALSDGGPHQMAFAQVLKRVSYKAMEGVPEGIKATVQIVEDL